MIAGPDGRSGGLNILWSLLCLPTLVLGFVLSFAGSTHEEHEQVVLLPFADDLEAARRVARDTGKICRQVVRPLEESRGVVGPSLLA